MLEILTLDEFKQRNLVVNSPFYNVVKSFHCNCKLRKSECFQGKASVIEIGSKIHECRVDRVRKSTSKLAAEVTSNTVVEEALNSADESITGPVAAQPRGTKNQKVCELLALFYFERCSSNLRDYDFDTNECFCSAAGS